MAARTKMVCPRTVTPRIPEKIIRVQFIPSTYYKVGWWNKMWYLVKPGLVADTTRVEGMDDALLYPCLQQDGDIALAVVTRKKQIEKLSYFETYREVLAIGLNNWIKIRKVDVKYSGYYEHEVVNLNLEPVWPTWSYNEYLMKAFANTFIKNLNHPLLVANTRPPERVIEEG